MASCHEVWRALAAVLRQPAGFDSGDSACNCFDPYRWWILDGFRSLRAALHLVGNAGSFHALACDEFGCDGFGGDGFGFDGFG